MKKLTTEEFIKKARKVHGDKYDYSKVTYVNSKVDVIIICPEHGEFRQKPNDHLNGVGCPKCSGCVRSTTEEFIKKARKVHGDKYDYSKVNYINNRTKVKIICPEHGEFEQGPKEHLIGHGCPKCNGGVLQTTEEFIKRAREIHGDKYDYSKVNYINSSTEVIIICPEHGEFKQSPGNHLKGYGCPKCGLESRINKIRSTTEEFIKKARKVHGDKYDYSKVNYINAKTKVTIICPKHGEFYQKPNDHLDGHGCPMCCSSTLENFIRFSLNKYNIKYIEQKSWDWLIFADHQQVDFYLPEYNCCIECQGLQHFTTSSYFDQNESLEQRLIKDSNKQKLCREHGIIIYYFSNIIKGNISKNFKYPYQVFEDFDEMFKFIKYDFDFYNNNNSLPD